ncbi:MAG: type VI secretion system baseplate subunit TssK [Alphaproteobacteria bacterium]|nr:type VI secretion system baseplate subunit TssK [Alphaproteobacteria bacterium]MBF0130574.1 type VI secretion system baseplate subunit TssK [Alphaproteobacteria bacterium]
MTDIHPPDAIQWHEGMLLAPQHFQQLALRQESLLHAHLHLASPFHWGVLRLSVDAPALADGVFRVRELEAVMPDGLLIRHAGTDDDLLVDLSPLMDGIRKRPLRIFVAVPLAPGEGDGPERYASVEGAPVADANTGEGGLRIPRLRPRLSLLAVDRPPGKYTGLPLAEVVFRDGALALGDFVAPSLRVSPESELGRRCAAVAARLREKALSLASRVQTPTAAIGHGVVLDRRTVIHGLVAGLPPFEAILATGVSHPFTVYVALCGLIGHLTALSGGMVPPAPPAFSHDDPRTPFTLAIDIIDRLIDGVRKAYGVAAFTARNGALRLVLKESWLGAPLVIGVRHRAGAADSDAAAWIENSLIGSESTIRSIGERRILGAARRIIDRDDRLGVTPPPGVTLFSVANDPGFIRAGEPMVILNRGDPRGEKAPAEVTLYIPGDDDAADGAP